jgi:hypothetical protein
MAGPSNAEGAGARSTDDDESHTLPSGAFSVEASTSAGGGGISTASAPTGEKRSDDARAAHTSDSVRASSMSRINLCQPGVVAPVPLQSSAALSAHPRRRKKQYDRISQSYSAGHLTKKYPR